jgi:hypothetical protein
MPRYGDRPRPTTFGTKKAICPRLTPTAKCGARFILAWGKTSPLLWQDAIPKKKWDYVAVGYALRAWGFQTGGDLYDHMIVKEAFDPTRLTFDYDDGSVVYAEVVKDCQLALNYMNLAIKTDNQTISPTLAKGDYMYYGDRSKWIKFIYAILAQNALHQSNKATFNADNVKKYADSSFVSNADNASVECKGSQSGDSNFWGPTRGNIGSVQTIRLYSSLAGWPYFYRFYHTGYYFRSSY